MKEGETMQENTRHASRGDSPVSCIAEFERLRGDGRHASKEQPLKLLLVTCDLPSHPYAIAKLAQVVSVAGHQVTAAAPAGSALDRIKQETKGFENIECVQCGTVSDAPPMNCRPVVDPLSWKTLFSALRNPMPIAGECDNMVESQQGMYAPIMKTIEKGDFDMIIPIHSVAPTVCDAVEALKKSVPVTIFSSLPYDASLYLGEYETWRSTRSLTALPHVSTYSSKPALGLALFFQIFWKLLDAWLTSRAWAHSAIANNKRRAARGLPPTKDGFRGYLQRHKVITFGGIPPFFDIESAPIASNVTVLGALQEQPSDLSGDLKTWLDAAENGVVYVGFGTGTVLSDEEIAAVTGDLMRSLNEHVASPRVLFALRASEQKRLRSVIDTSMGEEPAASSATHMEYLNGKLRIQESVPQAALLMCCDKIRLFISHMGMGGYVEGVRGGIPFIAYPSGCDQYFNAQRAVDAGIAIKASPKLEGIGDLVNMSIRDVTLSRAAKEASVCFVDAQGGKRAVKAIEAEAAKGKNDYE